MPAASGRPAGGGELTLKPCIALAGVPNAGKTTLFNALTGQHARVGNFPGVTVECRSAPMRGGGELVDLPGTYSLRPRGGDEQAALDFLLSGQADTVICVLDALHPARGLALALQLLELKGSLLLALNMADELAAAGGRADAARLSRLLGVPVFLISAATGLGLDALAAAVRPASGAARPRTPEDTPEAALARCERAESLCRSCFVLPDEAPGAKRSRRLDRLALGRWTAFPVFFGIMAGVFALTFGPAGGTLSRLMARGFSLLAELARGLCSGLPAPLTGLLCDGVISGVGGVVAFLPLVLTLFALLSVLEDTGYMARVACIFDRPMGALGLTGRAAVPLLTGFGCTVPAVMAARTLETPRARRVTALLTPFMSCSAKLPVYALFCAAFFPGRGLLVMVCLYLGGVLAAVTAALALKTPAGAEGFLLELPDYRLPRAKNVLRLLREKAGDFLKRAFTVILTATVLVWFLRSFDVSFGLVADPAQSLLAGAGRFLAPVFAPLGFGDWRAVTALAAGLAAKEAAVGVLGVLAPSLAAVFTPASAVSYLVFTLLYAPCAAAFAALRRELGWLIAGAAAVFQCAGAWLAAWGVYLIARL